MKRIFYFLAVFTVFSCNKNNKEKELHDTYLNKDFFVLSEYEKYCDRIINEATKNDSVQIIDLYRDKEQAMGALHFLMVNDSTSYFVYNDLSPFSSNWCGWETNDKESLKRDSLLRIDNTIKKIAKAQLIKNTDIVKIVEKYKDSITHTYNRQPLAISFAFMNDTLKGPTMYNTIKYMEDNGMKSYFMRKMNKKEVDRVTNQ